MSEQLEVSVDSIAAGGDGVGRHDGMAVFIPRTAPGDVAIVEATRKQRLIRARLVKLKANSPDRVEPPCIHYVRDRCGGCQLQHMSYPAQVQAKSRIISDALFRIGRVSADPPEVETSGKEWRYRNKLTLALRRRGSGWIAGLHRYDAPDEVFQLEDCPITDQQVVDAWRRILGHQDLLPYANELRAAVRLLPDGFSFVAEGGTRWSRSAQLFHAIPNLTELWWAPSNRPRQLLHTRELDTRAGASFTQVNREVARSLRDWVIRVALDREPRTAIDGYAGTGDIAVELSGRGIRVTAIEIDRAAARVCAERMPPGSRVVGGAMEQVLGGALPAELVVVNPPRTGLHEEVAAILRDHAPHPAAVVYVSCNPATLARDIGRMGRYRVASLRGFDMFPQTAHVETVCELVPIA